MKTNSLIPLLSIFLTTALRSAAGCPDPCPNPPTSVGPLTFNPGYTFFANQLNSSLAGGNTLKNLFPNAPNGTKVYTYNCTVGAYIVSTYVAASGTWINAVTLDPGKGAIIQTPGTASWSQGFNGSF